VLGSEMVNRKILELYSVSYWNKLDFAIASALTIFRKVIIYLVLCRREKGRARVVLRGGIKCPVLNFTLARRKMESIV